MYSTLLIIETEWASQIFIACIFLALLPFLFYPLHASMLFAESVPYIALFSLTTLYLQHNFIFVPIICNLILAAGAANYLTIFLLSKKPLNDEHFVN